MLDESRPVIIIGTGRTGSHLLCRILNAHSDIAFFGETAFLTPRLWSEIWVGRWWLLWKAFQESEAFSSLDPYGLPNYTTDFVEREKKRCGETIARTILAVLGIDRTKYHAWGHKEIWNGYARTRYDWEIYDFVFPRAIWVHLVRNPFNFARSFADLHKKPLTLGYLKKCLNRWKSCVDYSRERRRTGRYFEIRYEDLVQLPEKTLAPLFQLLELPWSESCLAPLSIGQTRRNRGATALGSYSEDDVKSCGSSTSGLHEVMTELGYEMPACFEKYVVRKGKTFNNVRLVTPGFNWEEVDADPQHKPLRQLNWELDKIRRDPIRYWLSKRGLAR